ncbi:hypothetical protein [Euzebya sp.]|uniref:hypothetical protein n=1 Tax=Euzebya sp. TaxID=1971409 RepID=UPI003511ECC0
MGLLSEDQVIVGVAGRDDVEAMADFVARHELDDVVHIADVDGDVWAEFGIPSQPAWAFVGAGDDEATVRFGALGRDGVLDAFESGGL